MKKKWLPLFFLSLFSLQSFAYEGIVIVLEAPLLKEADLSSKVLQFIRKGQRVYVPRESFNDDTIPDYYQTFDRAGNTAFIPSKYVKVIFEETNEDVMPISYEGIDPTDYRLEEPIPTTYPYENRSFLRASFAYMMASNSKSAYDYQSTFIKQNYHFENGGRLAITMKAPHDKYDRFYFGVLSMISTTKNTINFTNGNIASESRDRFRIGPLLTYDVFKNEKYRATFGTGFTFNYHKASIVMANETLSEERLLSGFSLSPYSSFNFQLSEIIPNADFVTGIDFSMFLPYSLKTISNIEVPELWGNDNSKISEGFKANVSGFIGMQVRY